MISRNGTNVALLLAMLLPASASWAKDTWKKDLEKALAERYPLSKQESKKVLGITFKAGNDIQRLGTIFAVNIENVIGEPTNTGHSTYFVTQVENGKVQQSGGGFLGGLTGNTARVGRRSLRVGERLTPVAYDVKDDAVLMTFTTIETDTFMYQGTQFSDHLFGILAFRFPRDVLASATVDQIAPAIDAVLSVSKAKSEGPVTISLGQSQDEVRHTLGAPEKVIELGPKTIWVYKDMKVVFMEGKVSDVQ